MVHVSGVRLLPASSILVLVSSRVKKKKVRAGLEPAAWGHLLGCVPTSSRFFFFALSVSATGGSTRTNKKKTKDGPPSYTQNTPIYSFKTPLEWRSHNHNAGCVPQHSWSAQKAEHYYKLVHTLTRRKQSIVTRVNREQYTNDSRTNDSYDKLCTEKQHSNDSSENRALMTRLYKLCSGNSTVMNQCRNSTLLTHRKEEVCASTEGASGKTAWRRLCRFYGEARCYYQ